MIRFDSNDWPKTIALPQGATVTVRRPSAELRLDLAVATDGLLDAVPVPEDGPQLERFVGLQKRLFRYTKAVACLGIESWDGIEDADGTPLPCTPETIASVLDHVTGVWQVLYREYVEPHFLEVDAEKNASTPSHATPEPIVDDWVALRPNRPRSALNLNTPSGFTRRRRDPPRISRPRAESRVCDAIRSGAGAGTIAAPAETSATTVETPVTSLFVLSLRCLRTASPTDQAASKAA